MKITTSQLINLKVRYGIEEDELYFDILEIKNLFPDLKFPADKIKTVFIGGVSAKGIRPQDIEEMTEFDKNVVKFMKAKKGS